MAEVRTIYDDVEDLIARVTALENNVTILQNYTGTPTVLTENTDLHNLPVGNYIIPSATVCATLLNRPTTNTSTAFIKVVEGGGAGQKMMYYIPCAKEGASYWQKAYYLESWGDWHDVDVFDSGWIDMALTGDVIAYNEEQKPRYRRIGKEVFITGVVKNITASNTVIATLPANYRPSKKIIYAAPSTGERFDRISILTNGVITFEQNDESTAAATYWHSIAVNYNVD